MTQKGYISTNPPKNGELRSMMATIERQPQRKLSPHLLINQIKQLPLNQVHAIAPNSWVTHMGRINQLQKVKVHPDGVALGWIAEPYQAPFELYRTLSRSIVIPSRQWVSLENPCLVWHPIDPTTTFVPEVRPTAFNGIAVKVRSDITPESWLREGFEALAGQSLVIEGEPWLYMGTQWWVWVRGPRGVKSCPWDWLKLLFV